MPLPRFTSINLNLPDKHKKSNQDSKYNFLIEMILRTGLNAAKENWIHSFFKTGKSSDESA